MATALVLIGLTGGCSGEEDPLAVTEGTPSTEAFLETFTEEIRPLWAASRAAEWEAHTHVAPGETRYAEEALEATQAYQTALADVRWQGLTSEVLAAAQGELDAFAAARAQVVAAAEDESETDLPAEDDAEAIPTAPPVSSAQMAALRTISRLARDHDADTAALRARIAQTQALQLRFRARAEAKLDGEVVDAAEVAGQWRASTDDAERMRTWRAVLYPARELKPGYLALRDLRNELAQAHQLPHHHAAMVADLDLSSDEAMAWLSEAREALRPLLTELHTYARHELAARYGVSSVPEVLPAHWVDHPLAATWEGPFAPSRAAMADTLSLKGAATMVRDADDWFITIGLDPLPAEFWSRSSLVAPGPEARYGKTGGASTWHLDARGDVRTLLSATPTPAWLHAAHRELAFAHSALLRVDAGLPTPLQMQPPGPLQLALAQWADLTSARPERLAELGLLDPVDVPPLERSQLVEALRWVPYVAFAAGTAAEFEHEIYAESLPEEQFNRRFWQLATEHQGVVPGGTRTERWADPLVVSAFTDTPGHYVDHALATLMAFQLHVAAANQAGLPAHATDLAGTDASELFIEVAQREGIDPWADIITDVTGRPPSADAMVEYFAPLTAWLAARNEGRTPTLPQP